MNERRGQHGKRSDAADQPTRQRLAPAPEASSRRIGPESRTPPGEPAERRSERALLSPFEVCAPSPCPPPEQKWIPRRLNLVFEAAGVLGIAEVGAVAALSEALVSEEKYKDTYISYLAGTSAGAIIAALLGAGYTHTEIADLVNIDIAKLTKASGISRIPVVGAYAGMAWGLLTRLGWFRSEYFLQLLRDALRAKGIRTFGDMVMPGCEAERDPARRYRVHVIASDITRGRMLVLPDDVNADLYGVEPDDLDVAQAVLMSSSMPLWAPPVRVTGANGVESYIVDGALTSGFPIHLFDVGAPETADTLTLGIRVKSERYHAAKFPSLYHMAKAVMATASSARDVSEISKRIDKLKWARAIQINTGTASSFERLSPLRREVLYNAGYLTMKRAIDANILERATPVHAAAGRAEQDASGLTQP
ncbi:patatin-like phospholipase family protein [Sorangium sp. So ce1389]|uniref:patatin-like phospholipase family protein n=1 Tax=Sorangium sp. So ce1389 TaxID=3133336 RepID=UPI003F5FBEA1